MSFNGGVPPPAKGGFRPQRRELRSIDQGGLRPVKNCKNTRSPAVGLNQRSSEREKSRRVS